MRIVLQGKILSEGDFVGEIFYPLTTHINVNKTQQKLYPEFSWFFRHVQRLH